MSLEAQAIIDGLNAYQYPSVYPYVQRVLVASSAIYFFVLVLCMSILAIPLFRGVQARRKHLWFWRKQYLPGRTDIPYLIPNGGLAVVISQFFGCIIFEVYILLSYRALRSPEFSQSHYQYFWLTISYAPGYFGFWYSGFSALYICLFSPSRAGSHYPNKQRHMPHPIIMNTICIGTPIFTALGAIGWGIASVVTAREKNMAYDAVLEQLANGSDPTLGLQRYAEAGNRFIGQFRWASFCWTVAAFVAVVFYCITIILFLRLLKGTVDVARGKTNLLSQTERSCAVDEGGKSTVLVSSTALVVAPPLQNSRLAQNLRNGYRFLVWHCGLLTIVLIWYFVVGIFLTVKIEKIPDHEGWRSLSIWTVVSSSFLLSAALLLQSWRVLTDRDVTHEGPPPPALVNTPKQTNDYNVLNLDRSIQFRPSATGMERANSTTQMLPNPLSITDEPLNPQVL